MDQRGRFQPRFQPFLFKLLLFFVCFVCVKCEEVSACSFQFSSQQIPISSGVLDNELVFFFFLSLPSCSLASFLSFFYVLILFTLLLNLGRKICLGFV